MLNLSLRSLYKNFKPRNELGLQRLASDSALTILLAAHDLCYHFLDDSLMTGNHIIYVTSDVVMEVLSVGSVFCIMIIYM